MLRNLLAAGVAAATLAGCSPDPGLGAPTPGTPAAPAASPSRNRPSPPPPTVPAPAPRASGAATSATRPTMPSGPSGPSGPPGPPGPPGPSSPAGFDRTRAVGHVRALAGRIGPRLATGAAYRRAADLVARRFAEAGYRVSHQRVRVPAGDSWGVPVAAGTSANVVARPRGLGPGSPYLLVGAHLDTVAVAPGAEDNASGVAVLLEVARLASVGRTRLPVVLVAFGAEEPRGPGDDRHHFGSRAYVRRMAAAERRGLRGMVSLDRVGVGARVPVCTGPLSGPGVRDALVAAARRLGIPTVSCGENTSSDHWSFEKAGLPVARLGSTPYAAYHSARDVPAVVDPAQLDRAGRLIWGWLRAG